MQKFLTVLQISSIPTDTGCSGALKSSLPPNDTGIPRIFPVSARSRLYQSVSVCRGKMAHLSYSSSSISWSQLPAASSTGSGSDGLQVCWKRSKVSTMQPWCWAFRFLSFDLFMLPYSINKPHRTPKSALVSDNLVFNGCQFCSPAKKTLVATLMLLPRGTVLEWTLLVYPWWVWVIVICDQWWNNLSDPLL